MQMFFAAAARQIGVFFVQHGLVQPAYGGKTAADRAIPVLPAAAGVPGGIAFFGQALRHKSAQNRGQHKAEGKQKN